MRYIPLQSGPKPPDSGHLTSIFRILCIGSNERISSNQDDDVGRLVAQKYGISQSSAVIPLLAARILLSE